MNAPWNLLYGLAVVSHSRWELKLSQSTAATLFPAHDDATRPEKGIHRAESVELVATGVSFVPAGRLEQPLGAQR